MNTNNAHKITVAHLACADKCDKLTVSDARPIGPREIKRPTIQVILARIARYVSRYNTNGDNDIKVESAGVAKIDFSRFAKTVRKSRGLRTTTGTYLTVFASYRLLRSGIEDLPGDIIDLAPLGAATPYGIISRCTMMIGESKPVLTLGYVLRLTLGSSHEWIIVPDAVSPTLTARRLTHAASRRYALHLDIMRNRA